MDVNRRSRWANGFQALAENVAQQAGAWNSRLQAGVVRKQQQDFESKKQNDAQLQQFIQTLGAHPEQYDQLSRGARAQGIDLTPYAPTAAERSRPLEASIQGAKAPTDLPTDIVGSLKSLGVDTTPGFGPTGSSDGSDGSLPSEQLGPTQNPLVSNMQGQVKGRQAMFDAEDASKVEQAGKLSYANSFNSGLANTQVENANFPTKLSQHGQLANVDAMAPYAPNVTAASLRQLQSRIPVNAAQAGATAGATFDAEHTPARIASKATEAGAITGAQEQAKGPTPIDKQAAAFYNRAQASDANALSLEKGGVSALGSTWLPDFLQSDASKQYNLAKREFMLSALRKETGAAISKDEEAKFAGYFAQPGDSPAVLEAKQAARTRFLDGLKFEASKGLNYLPNGARLPEFLPAGSTVNRLLGKATPVESAPRKLDMLLHP